MHDDGRIEVAVRWSPAILSAALSLLLASCAEGLPSSPSESPDLPEGGLDGSMPPPAN